MDKSLTIWQPWATLKVRGIKKYLTSGWETDYRGVVFIYAARRKVAGILESIPGDQVALLRQKALPDMLELLPTGVILGKGVLVDCHPITESFVRDLTPEEIAMGDFTPGRYAWEFADMEEFTFPLSVKGKQGLYGYSPLVQTFLPAKRHKGDAP